MSEEYLSVKQVAERWNVTVRRVQMMCTSGQLPGAKKNGQSWVIPADAERPMDNRIVNGQYIKPRDKSAKGKKPDTTIGHIADYQLLYAISRDIRTELNAIIGYADLLQDHPNEAGLVRSYADVIEVSGKNILKITNNLVLLNRLQNGEEIVKNEAGNVREAADTFIEQAKLYAAGYDIALREEISIQHEYLEFDSEKMHRICQNLVEHSVRHIGSKGNIRIFADEIDSEREGYAKIRYVFEDDATGTYAEGIEIPVVKLLVELMGGNIRIEHRTGMGTRMTVLLEHKIAEEVTQVKRSIDLNENILSGLRVLLVEDNELSRTIETDILTDAGMEVDTAEDGIIAVAKVRMEGTPYDCVFMDIQMPNVDGVAATRIIRDLKDKEKANTPIIAMTANVFEKDRDMILSAGADGFIEKPLETERIVQQVQRALKKRSEK